MKALVYLCLVGVCLAFPKNLARDGRRYLVEDGAASSENGVGKTREEEDTDQQKFGFSKPKIPFTAESSTNNYKRKTYASLVMYCIDKTISNENNDPPEVLEAVNDLFNEIMNIGLSMADPVLVFRSEAQQQVIYSICAYPSGSDAIPDPTNSDIKKTTHDLGEVLVKEFSTGTYKWSDFASEANNFNLSDEDLLLYDKTRFLGAIFGSLPYSNEREVWLLKQ